MPRTKITAQAVTSAGLTPGATEPANVDGNSFDAVAHRLVEVVNGSAGAVTVTVPTPGTVDGLAIADRTASIAAGARWRWSPGDGNAYRQTGGVIHLDYSAVTSVTVAVFDVI